MGPTVHINLSNTLPRVRPCLACEDTNIHAYCEIECKEEKYNANGKHMQMERLEPKDFPDTKALIQC